MDTDEEGTKEARSRQAKLKQGTEKKLEELMVDAKCLNLWEVSFRSRAEFFTLLLLLAYT